MVGEQSECAASWQLANKMRNRNNEKDDGCSMYGCLCEREVRISIMYGLWP